MTPWRCGCGSIVIVFLACSSDTSSRTWLWDSGRRASSYPTSQNLDRKTRRKRSICTITGCMRLRLACEMARG